MDEILLKYLAGSASIEERDLARKWIYEKIENQKYFENFKNIYQISKLGQSPSGFNKEDGWIRVKSEYYQKKFEAELENTNYKWKKTVIRIVSISAAAILITFILTTFISRNSYNKQISSQNIYNEITVPLGAKSQIILSDGTKVWLNAGSTLKFPVSFSSETREVYLEGEAFFNVTKNKKSLFVVKTSGINVKVYGTEFNIKSYPEEKLIQTTLVNGSVTIEEIGGKSAKKIAYLKPNETATYFKTTSSIDISNKDNLPKENIQQSDKSVKIIIDPETDVTPIISWKDNRWIIDGEELGSLSIMLERRYNVTISLENKNLESYKFSGTLTNETFEQVLKIMQLSAPIIYSVSGNHVIIKEDPMYKKKYDESITHNN